MFLNKSLWTKIGIVFGCCAAVGAVVGGYFAVSKLDKFRDYYVAPSVDTSRGFINAYKNAIYNGAEALLAPGFTHKDPIVESFKEYYDFFKDKGFLLFDEKFGATDPGASNSWSITFRSDLGSIQTGIAMCMLLNQYQDVFLEGDNKLTYALYGGLPFSSVTSFMGGIQHGVKWFNDNIIKNPAGRNVYRSMDGTRQIDYKPVEMVTSDIDYFAGGFGPSQGTALTAHFLNKGVDILMPVAGPQTWTAMQQIKKLNKKTLLLGVDSSMENDPLNETLPFKSKHGIIGNGKYVQFSSVKNLAKAAVKALQIINNGNVTPAIPAGEEPTYFKNFASNNGAPGGVGGFGTVAVGDIENGCVGVSDAGKPLFEEALKIAGKPDPATEAFYSEEANMIFNPPNADQYPPSTGDDGSKIPAYPKNYGAPPFGLGKAFVDLFENNPEGKKSVLNIKGFIKKGNASDADKIKVVLSTTTSVLMDSSFSQSCYEGLLEYMRLMDITIPSPHALSYNRRFDNE